MEQAPQIRDDKSVFYNRLLSEGLVDEVRPGLAVKAEDYTFLKGDEFAVQNLIDMLTGYLAKPTLIDSFASHEDRIQAFNKSGVLDSPGNSKLYLSNRLRVNSLLSALSTLEVTVRIRELPESFRDFVQSEINGIDLSQYPDLDVDQKILFTQRLAAACVNVINQAVTENIIKGPPLEPDTVSEQ